MDKPLVSICCLTYNHGRYIRQCLDGFIMQKTSFPFEVLIYDDASTDNNAEILKEYEAKYPNIIKPICETENRYSRGLEVANTYFYSRVQGKYLAMCEGDDYWTDPLKLQKQVDFLERNPDYTICGGGYQLLYDGKEQPEDNKEFDVAMRHYPFGKTITLDNFLEPYLLLTLTACFRTDSFSDLSKFKHIKDDVYWAVILEKGKGFIFPEVFGVYRKHQHGMWSGESRRKQLESSSLYISELYQHYKKKSSSIRNTYFYVKLELLFFDLKEHKNKYKVYWDMAKLVLSGNIRYMPYRIKEFVKRAKNGNNLP